MYLKGKGYGKEARELQARTIRGKHGMVYVYVGGVRRGFVTDLGKRGYRYRGKPYKTQREAVEALLIHVGLNPYGTPNYGQTQHIF